MNKEDRGIEINLMQIVVRLLENARYILLVTCIFGILGYAYTAMFMTPIYQAGTKLMVNAKNDQNQNMTNDQYNVSRNLVETYAVILRSRDVLDDMQKELDLKNITYEELAGAISVKSVNNTQVMQINVRHADRNTAIKIANYFHENASEVLEERANVASVQKIEQAFADPSPVSPSKMKNTVLMAFMGGFISCLTVFVIMLADNTYKTDLDIQKDLGLHVLGVIPAYESCTDRTPSKKEMKGANNP